MLDYARKPFVDTNYRDLIKGIPEKAVYDKQRPYGIFEKQAEFKRPYLETEFRKMKERHTAKIPYLPESAEYDTAEVIPAAAATENIPEDELEEGEEIIVPDPLRWGDNTADNYNNKTIDCLIYEANPDFSYSASGITVGKGAAADRTNRGLIKFNIKDDLDAIGAPEITSALLYLQPDYIAGSHTISAYRVFQDWNENQATWNSYSGGKTWNTAGCAAANDGGSDDGSYDRKATAEATDSTFSISAYTAIFDLTDLAKEWLSGAAKEYGILLQSDNEATINEYLRMNQREDADGIRPFLLISFKGEEGEEVEEEPGEPVYVEPIQRYHYLPENYARGLGGARYF